MEIVLGLQLGNVAKDRLEGRHFARHGVVDHEFEYAIVIRPYSVQVRQAGGK
jgi:hypothetical protein